MFTQNPNFTHFSSYQMVELVVYFELSDHDGYCSGDQCDYVAYTKTVIVPIPYFYDQLVIDGDKVKNCNDYDWSIYLHDKYKMNANGSYFCHLSPEAEDHGLTRHDCRMTVLSATVLNLHKE
jgi:hypothetical protein